MFSNFIFYLSLIILGMIAMRFGIIQIRQYKKGETKIKKKALEQIAFGIFFIIILGLIIYSVDGLLFNNDYTFSPGKAMSRLKDY